MPIKAAKKTIVILSLALAGCRGAVAPASPTPTTVSLRLFADGAVSPLLQDLISHYHPPRLLISWDIQTGETSTVLGWLQNSDTAYALTDYLPPDSLNSNASSGGKLWSTPIGQDGIAIVVHPLNPIARLSATQLRAILQGRSQNWQSLDGTDLEIVPVVRNDSSSAAAIIQSMVMGDRQTTRSAQLATTSQGVIELVSANPGAIGYVSMGYLNDSVRAVPLDDILPTPHTVSANQYPLRSPILFVGLHEPGEDAYRAFFAWTQSSDGQAIVRQHYGGLDSTK